MRDRKFYNRCFAEAEYMLHNLRSEIRIAKKQLAEAQSNARYVSYGKSRDFNEAMDAIDVVSNKVDNARKWERLIRECEDAFHDRPEGMLFEEYYDCGNTVTVEECAVRLNVDRQTINRYRDLIGRWLVLAAAEDGLFRGGKP